MRVATHQPWIYKAWTDVMFILAPPFVSLLVILLFLDDFSEADVSMTSWILLILLIDVAHVYSTLYRTYFDKETFGKHKSILVYIPLAAWLMGVLVYELSPLFFWRLLAYLAVFHFVRQQYGFMRIYSRREESSRYFSLIDTVAIYAGALYPIFYWHTHAPRNFHWFVEGDFYFFHSEWLAVIAWWLYLLVILTFLIKEIFQSVRNRSVNIPKNLIILGTFLSWYFGIVYFNGDLIFTTLNVVSHGVPYMALVWMYGKKKYGNSTIEASPSKMKFFFTGIGVLLFLSVIFMLAYFEEGLWDGLVWKERKEVFPLFSALPSVSDKDWLALIVPALSLPQISHYLIDGFIWKISKDKYNWKKVTLS